MECSGSVEDYSDNTARSMKRRSFQMYSVHVLLLNFSAEIRFRRNFIYNGQTLVGLLPGEYNDKYPTVQRIDVWEDSENANIRETSELKPLESSIAQTTV